MTSARAITGPEMLDRIAGIKSSAFRMEHQPHYELPEGDHEVEAFAAGHPVVPGDDDPWFAMIRGLTASGCSVVRVRVHEDPPTLYQRWLAWLVDVAATPAGEHVRAMTRPRAVEVGLLPAAGPLTGGCSTTAA